MDNIFLCYTKCSTCKKAYKKLKDMDIEIKYHDMVAEKLSRGDIEKIVNLSGKNINDFFNKSGMVYRELKLKDKLSILSKEEKLDLLASDGKLIKRPILIFNNNIFIGYKEEVYETLVK